MSHPAREPERAGVPTPSATYKVKFGKDTRPGMPHAENKSIARVPRVTRLLALAHRIDGMIRSGELKDWAEAAQVLGVTRARMTQIANLMLLSPEIQEAILSLPPIPDGREQINEHNLRRISGGINWRQNSTFRNVSDLVLPAC